MRTFVLVVVLFLVSTGGTVRPALGLQVGDLVPDFTLTDVNGKEVRLYDCLEAGKIVILEHLNVYCHTCREAIPVMNEIHAKYAGERIRMIAIALNNSASEVSTFRKRFDARYEVVPDPERTTLPLFSPENVPTLDIVDSSGTLRYRHVGKFGSLEEFDHAIKPMLGEECIVGVNVGNQAPLLKLPSLDGQEFALEDLRGTHRVILAFFSDLSDKTIAQLKIMNKVQRRYEGKGVALLAVAEGMSAEALREFHTANELQYPILLDAGGTVAEAYRVERFPRLWVINEAGRVRYKGEATSLNTFDGILSGEIVGARFALSEEEAEYWMEVAVPPATGFRSVGLKGGIIYEALWEDTVVGLVRIVGKDVLCDVCKDVHFVYSVDMEGRLVSMFMIEPMEEYYGGDSMPRFRQQLVGHSLTDPLVRGQNIYGISGYTNSTIMILEGINETYKLLEEYKNPNFMVAFRKGRCFENMRVVDEAVQRYNKEHPDAPMITLDLEKLRDYLPGGEVPTCPLDGTYVLTDFGGKTVILCTFHGVDLERYGITFE